MVFLPNGTGGSVDCNRFILGVVCQDTAVVEAVISVCAVVLLFIVTKDVLLFQVFSPIYDGM